MVELTDFYNYLSATTNLSESTFKKYESAVRVTSKQMLEIGVIDKPFYEMTPDEFEVALLLTLNNEEFKTKNKIGNNSKKIKVKDIKEVVNKKSASTLYDII